MKTWLNGKNTVIFIGLLTLWRVFLSATLQLHPDEAYYWLWSRHLDIGYFDHAPLIAWFIKLTTLFSQGELWVRMSGILVSLVLSFLAWLLAMQMFASVPVAAASVIVLNIMPLTMSGSIIITPDIPSFLFWAAAVFLCWQIVRTGKASYWYLAGLAFGLGLLSKYTNILLAPCLFLFLLISDERKWLKTVHPYLAFALGCALFLPVVYWNSLHEWISFRFQFGHGLGGQTYSLSKVMEYIGGQMLIAGPVVWITGITAGFAVFFRPSKEKLFLCCMSLPVICFFAYSSLKQVAGPNWPAFAYFAFSILFSAFLAGEGRLKKAVLVLAIITSFCMSAIATLHARFSILPLAHWSEAWAIADATNWFYGWRELGQYISKNYPDARYALIPSHQISAVVEYYSRGQLIGYADLAKARPSQYNIWQFPEGRKAEAGIYMYFAGEEPGPYQKAFASIAGASTLVVKRNNVTIRRYQIIHGKDITKSDIYR